MNIIYKFKYFNDTLGPIYMSSGTQENPPP